MKGGSTFLENGYWGFVAAIAALASGLITVAYLDRTPNPFLMMTTENFYQDNIVNYNSFFKMQSSADTDNADLVVSISSGTDKALPSNIITFNITCENKGTIAAENTKFGLSFPKELSYLLDTSGSTPGQNSAGIVWQLGTLKAGEKKSFDISMLSGLPNPAGGQLMTVTAFIKTSSPEKNLSDNKAVKEFFLFPSSDIARNYSSKLLTFEPNYQNI